uniref:Uncharacterized protein n=1 Tax=uncultured marine bacterium 580 TaxID=257400 RepID=Q6SFM3_9BACT|nr:hypothetical protein MBMO_EBAC000-36A07.34 [uncultured marine bacterium 580]
MDFFADWSRAELILLVIMILLAIIAFNTRD